MSLGVMGDDDWKFLNEEMGNSISDEDRAIRSKDQLADIGEMIVASLKDENGRCDFEKSGRRLAGLIEYGMGWKPTYPEISVWGFPSLALKFWDHRKEFDKIGRALNLVPAIDWYRLEVCARELEMRRGRESDKR